MTRTELKQATEEYAREHGPANGRRPRAASDGAEPHRFRRRQIRHHETAPCFGCGALDARDENHQQGCPALRPVSRERMLEIALACEAAWEEKTKAKGAAA